MPPLKSIYNLNKSIYDFDSSDQESEPEGSKISDLEFESEDETDKDSIKVRKLPDYSETTFPAGTQFHLYDQSVAFCSWYNPDVESAEKMYFCGKDNLGECCRIRENCEGNMKDYEICEEIFTDGKGIHEYKVTDRRSGELYTLKAFTKSENMVKCLTEIWTLEKLSEIDHPVEYYHLFETGKCIYLLKEWFACNFTELLKGNDFINIDSVMHIGMGSILALEPIHKLGIVINNINPSNVRLTFRGKIKYTDFTEATSQGGDINRDFKAVALNLFYLVNSKYTINDAETSKENQERMLKEIQRDYEGISEVGVYSFMLWLARYEIDYKYLRNNTFILDKEADFVKRGPRLLMELVNKAKGNQRIVDLARAKPIEKVFKLENMKCMFDMESTESGIYFSLMGRLLESLENPTFACDKKLKVFKEKCGIYCKKRCSPRCVVTLKQIKIELEQIVAVGRHSVVFPATFNNRKYVVKVCVKKERNIDRIRNEVNILCKVNHENVLGLLHIFETNLFVIMLEEKCDHKLSDLRYEELGKEKLEIFCIQIWNAFLYLNSIGITHTNFNFENTLLAGTTVKLSGFSLSVDQGVQNPPIKNKGTFPFVAPEVLVGFCAPSTPFYSLGLAVLHFVTGETIENVDELLEKNVTKDMPELAWGVFIDGVGALRPEFRTFELRNVLHKLLPFKNRLTIKKKRVLLY
ncbi:hypothetical protein MHBO_002060 [Bonamia ostreae]|uniref:Protein kinase domain-containing protein n=1 Tax=Bonamia ostreae TaxID=126728 RepID=A0ABV2AL42_9EUKA